MSFRATEDIRSVTDLKRHTHDILAHAHQTGRPVFLTVNGKADAILLDAKVYEKHLSANNLSRLLLTAEQDVRAGRTKPIRAFLSQFKRARKI